MPLSLVASRSTYSFLCVTAGVSDGTSRVIVGSESSRKRLFDHPVFCSDEALLCVAKDKTDWVLLASPVPVDII